MNRLPVITFLMVTESIIQRRYYIRTCPSYLNKFKSLLQTNTASTVYKKAIAETCSTCSTSVTAPRNMKQLRNLRFQHLQQNKISHDTLFKLHQNCIWHIRIYMENYHFSRPAVHLWSEGTVVRAWQSTTTTVTFSVIIIIMIPPFI